MRIKITELQGMIQNVIKEQLEEMGIDEAPSEGEATLNAFMQALAALKSDPKALQSARAKDLLHGAEEEIGQLVGSIGQGGGSDPGLSNVMPDVPGARVVGMQESLKEMIRKIVEEELHVRKSKKKKPVKAK